MNTLLLQNRIRKIALLERICLRMCSLFYERVVANEMKTNKLHEFNRVISLRSSTNSYIRVIRKNTGKLNMIHQFESTLSFFTDMASIVKEVRYMYENLLDSSFGDEFVLAVDEIADLYFQIILPLVHNIIRALFEAKANFETTPDFKSGNGFSNMRTAFHIEVSRDKPSYSIHADIDILTKSLSSIIDAIDDWSKILTYNSRNVSAVMVKMYDSEDGDDKTVYDVEVTCAYTFSEYEKFI